MLVGKQTGANSLGILQGMVRIAEIPQGSIGKSGQVAGIWPPKPARMSS
jgi:hypothetical protein